MKWSRVAADGLPVGTQVLCFPHVPVGECFAEYQRISAFYCLPLPETDLPRSHLLMAQQLGTVIFAMRRHPRDVTGETVVILGQGSAGLFFTHLLKRAGAARVIVADLSPTRLAVSAKYGADVVVNVATDDIREAVRDLTGGVGADYVVEAVGRDDTFLLTHRSGEAGRRAAVVRAAEHRRRRSPSTSRASSASACGRRPPTARRTSRTRHPSAPPWR